MRTPEQMGHSRIIHSARCYCLLVFLFLEVLALHAAERTVVMISIDGLRPDYVTAADQHGLKIPNLRRMMAEGAYAQGVTGVVPTVTYPSHTTLITGVSPARHGIYGNTTFDPEMKNGGGWYWYSEDIRVPTIWDVAGGAGLTTASVNWPVSVGAHVNFLLPEVWRANTPDDHKLMRAVSTPGLLAQLESELGPYANAIDVEAPADQVRTRFAVAILRGHKPSLMTVHLSALDHMEHEKGPFSPEANEVLERLDAMIGELRDAALSVDPQAIICVVSDHGFLPTSHRLNLGAAFLKAGLIQPGKTKSQFGTPMIESWQASPWIAGGLGVIMLKDPQDQTALKKTEALLKQLAADPASGINRIVAHEELVKLGGDPDASFLVDMKSGYQLESDLAGPVLRETKAGGAHGYLPEHPELRAAFFIAGKGIAAGRDLGVIDMRQVAPTLANLLGLKMNAEGEPIVLLEGAGPGTGK